MPTVIPTYPAGTQFVVYCWGPGCNGATRAGLIISELGYAVKEMIGGFEYWAREGLPVDAESVDAAGAPVTVDATRAVDPLTAPLLRGGARVMCD
jgi:3-mercaptopyruvate sulfurtransferase SseA